MTDDTLPDRLTVIDLGDIDEPANTQELTDLGDIWPHLFSTDAAIDIVNAKSFGGSYGGWSLIQMADRMAGLAVILRHLYAGLHKSGVRDFDPQHLHAARLLRGDLEHLLAITALVGVPSAQVTTFPTKTPTGATGGLH